MMMIICSLVEITITHTDTKKKNQIILHIILQYKVSSPKYLLHFDPPYSFIYYAYKSKLYFLCNEMMMIFCSLVKIIITHTHTHTKKNFFDLVKLSQLWQHIASHISRRQPKICNAAYVSSYTHILNITYTTTHNNMQI